MNPPIERFCTPDGRTFGVRDGEHEARSPDDSLWTDTFAIMRDEKPAGKLFRSLSYGKTAEGQPRWHASIRELYWQETNGELQGAGFDVAAFDTAEACLQAWGRSADQILNFANAKRLTSAQKEALFKCARDVGDQGEAMLKSWSGADQADSELYFCQRRVYVAVAHEGKDLEVALAEQDKRWREYAAGQAKKVDQAPKIKRGPSSGHSVISHRWVNPDAFTNTISHLRIMVGKCLEAK